jgi:hypothetical protein
MTRASRLPSALQHNWEWQFSAACRPSARVSSCTVTGPDAARADSKTCR